jgi:tetratricopeptide (TPR) repeat protein
MKIPNKYRRWTIGWALLSAGPAFAPTEFWAPLAPPRARYVIDAKISADGARLDGSAIIRFRNSTARPIGRVAFQWFGDRLRVHANGKPARAAAGKHEPALFDLPQEIVPGERLEIVAEFGVSGRLDARTGSAVASFFYPRLWWGFGTHDDYEVRLSVPEGFAIATSGRFDTATGTYKAENVRTFGLFVGKGYQSAEADAGEVRVRAVFTAKGKPCAEMLIKSAVDAIDFYRQRFGFYPHRSLSIVPGMDYPAGGYPAATGLIVVHGQERLAERPDAFWRWITAHEIGHQYWGEHVLAQGPDSLGWLMIGLGIHADREYRRARGITGEVGAQWPKYVSGVKEGIETTIDLTQEQTSAIKWDFNNIVTHGKSAALLNALESVISPKMFEAVYRRCLREYAGKRLGWREFQRVCEAESGEDLEWFFEPWVRSSKSVAYRVAKQECSPTAGGFDCVVWVERTGGLKMPVTVAAGFEDGSQQRARTERLADLDELRFRAKSPLKKVVVEPDSAVAMAEAPAGAERELRTNIRDLPWTGAGDRALAAYQQARVMKIKDAGIWRKLALTLYDGKHYQEALEVLAQMERDDPEARFFALVWQGHVLDLLGRRAEAVRRYEEALKMPGSPSWQHGQYNLTINQEWVQERLKAPFERR